MSIVTYVKNDVKSQLQINQTNTCQYCNKNYSSKSNLKAHLQRTKKCIDNRSTIKNIQNIDENTDPNNTVNENIDIRDINSKLISLIESNNKLSNIIIDMYNQIKQTIDKGNDRNDTRIIIR